MSSESVPGFVATCYQSGDPDPNPVQFFAVAHGDGKSRGFLKKSGRLSGGAGGELFESD